MKRNAFTLVEVLAVVVILGVIGVITVPMIFNVVVTAKRDTFVESAYSLVKAAENYRNNAIINHTERSLVVDFASEDNPLEATGEMPTSGNLVMDENGQIQLKIWSDKANICVTKDKDNSEVEISDLSKADCHL